jgi:hypothetical protein
MIYIQFKFEFPIRLVSVTKQSIMVNWLPIAIATGTFRGGYGGIRSDPDNPNNSISKEMAELCFQAGLSCGVVGLGWIGAILAKRKLFGFPHGLRTIDNTLVRGKRSIAVQLEDPTISEIPGAVTLILSGCFGVTSAVFYTYYAIDYTSYMIRKQREQSKQDESC